MPRFAPGTSGYDEARYRRERKGLQRRYDLVGALAGLGTLAQGFGSLRRARENEADQALMAEYLGRMYGGGEQGPVMAEDEFLRPAMALPSDKRMSYGAAPTTRDTVMAGSQMARGPEDLRQEIIGAGRQGRTIGDDFAALGRTFGIGSYQPRLRPEQQLALLQAQQGMASSAADRAMKERQLGFEERRTAAAELGAQAELARARSSGVPKGEDPADVLRFAIGQKTRSEREADLLDQKAIDIESGVFKVEQIIQDQFLAEQAASNPMFDKARRALVSLGSTPEQQSAARKAAAQSLREQASALRQRAGRWSGAEDAYLRGYVDPAVQQAGGGAMRQTAVDPNDFEAQWRARNKIGPGASLTPEQEDKILAEYEALYGAGG